MQQIADCFLLAHIKQQNYETINLRLQLANIRLENERHAGTKMKDIDMVACHHKRIAQIYITSDVCARGVDQQIIPLDMRFTMVWTVLTGLQQEFGLCSPH